MPHLGLVIKLLILDNRVSLEPIKSLNNMPLQSAKYLLVKIDILECNLIKSGCSLGSILEISCKKEDKEKKEEVKKEEEKKEDKPEEKK